MKNDITHTEESDLADQWLMFERLTEIKKIALLRKTQVLFSYALTTAFATSETPVKNQALRRIIPLIAASSFSEEQSIAVTYRLHIIATHTQKILETPSHDSQKIFECLHTFSINFKKESRELEENIKQTLSEHLDNYKNFKHPCESIIDNLVLFKTCYSEAFNKSTCCFAFFFKLFHKKGIQLAQDSTHVINIFEKVFKNLRHQADADRTVEDKIAILEELQELPELKKQIETLEKRISDHVDNADKRSTLFSLTKAPRAGAGPDYFKHFRASTSK